ncbi:hypothetical protein [Cysteiniphilum marinum]|uniref:hypothetical protein n=1 Tax=Cysteiniphilum marinum TaxID=2774191 RepID=UPI001939AE76|nr:hypothetical protein [Cysteiniphilum marinum]
MQENTTILRWNVYGKVSAFSCIGDIDIQTIKHTDALSKEHKIQVIYHKQGEEEKILNIPQHVSHLYPVILHDQPRLVIYGQCYSNTGDCHYVIEERQIKSVDGKNNEFKESQTAKAKRTKKSKLGTLFHVSTLYIFKDMLSIGRKVKRVAYKPTSISSRVVKDLKDVKPLFSFPDYERDQRFLDRFTDEQSQKLTRMYTCLAGLFVFIPYPYLWYYDLYGKGMGLFFIGIMYFLALMCVRARYEAKYKKRTKVFEFLWKLVMWRFM